LCNVQHKFRMKYKHKPIIVMAHFTWKWWN
jgi:hypothetical protein